MTAATTAPLILLIYPVMLKELLQLIIFGCNMATFDLVKTTAFCVCVCVCVCVGVGLFFFIYIYMCTYRWRGYEQMDFNLRFHRAEK